MSLKQDLQQLIIEIRSDKVKISTKATDRLDNILSNRKDEFLEAMSETSNELSWHEVFDSCVAAVIKHALKIEESPSANQQSLKNKCYTLRAVVSKITDYSIEANKAIKGSRFLDEILKILENDLLIKHFGQLMIEVLETGVLNIEEHLNEVTPEQFNNLISYLFATYGHFDAAWDSHILRTLCRLIELGTEYTQLGPDLISCLKNVKQIITGASDVRTNSEIIKLLSSILLNISVDYHQLVSSTLTNILPTICNFYDFQMKAEPKKSFFKICHIFLIIHFPDLYHSNLKPFLEDIDVDVVMKFCRRFFSIVQSEIRGVTTSLMKEVHTEYLPDFYPFAKDVCYLIFWSSDANENREEPRTKIQRKSIKIQGIMDVADPGEVKIVWPWYVILANMLENHPHLVDSSDLQPLLDLTVKVYKTFSTHDVEILKAVRICCEILFSKIKEHQHNTIINADYCNKLFHQIVELVSRNNSQNPEIQAENQKLFRFLVQCNTLPSDEFAVSLVRTLISTVGKNTNEYMETLKTILTIKGKLIKASSGLIEDLIIWLLESTQNMSAKIVVHRPDQITEDLMAENLALIIVDEMPFEKFNTNEKHCQTNTSWQQEMRTNILFKYQRKLIFTENKELIKASEQGAKDELSATAVKRTTNETHFKLFLKHLGLEEIPSCSVGADLSEIGDNYIKLIKLTKILNKLAVYSFLEMMKFSSFPLTKRVLVYIGQIENQLKEISIASIPPLEFKDIVMKIRLFFEIQYCDRMVEFLKEVNFQYTVKFLGDVIKYCSKKSYYPESSSLKRLLVYESSTCLALLGIEGKNCDSVIDLLTERDFVWKTKQDVIAFFNIIKILCKQTPHEDIADLIFKSLQELCVKYHQDKSISEMIVSSLKEVAFYGKSFKNYHHDIYVIISSFLKKCLKKTYSLKFVELVLNVVKHFARLSLDYIINKQIIQICSSIGKFLLSQSVIVRFLAIDCLSHIVNENWINPEKSDPCGVENFITEIYSGIRFADTNETATSDENNNAMATNLQCVINIFALNYSLRSTTAVKMYDYYLQAKMNEGLLQNNLREICNFYKCDIKTFSKSYSLHIIFHALRSNNEIDSLPWYLLSNTKESFLRDHSTDITFSALIVKPSVLDKLSSVTGIRKNELVMRVLPHCYSFLLPFLKKITTENIEYTSKARMLHNNLGTIIGGSDIFKSVSREMIEKVIYDLIRNFYDEENAEIFMKIELATNKEHISSDFLYNVRTYYTCLEYFLSLCQQPITTMKALIQEDPYQIILVLSKLKANIMKSIARIEKLLFMHRYFFMIDSILDLFGEEFSAGRLCFIREHFIRDSTTFLSQLVSHLKDDNALLIATLNFMNTYIAKICSDHSDLFGVYINITVRCLIALIKQDISANLCLKILNLIICENGKKFAKHIADIDAFPSSSVFETIRTSHEEIKREKYSDSLQNEINHFLAVPSRGIEAVTNMKNVIANKKDELIKLSAALNEDVISQFNPLHKLVKSLFIAVKGNDEATSMETVKCLGELGPIKLNTIALFPHVDESSYKILFSLQEHVEYLVQIILKQLDNMMATGNYEIIDTINNACATVVNSTLGRKYIDAVPLISVFKTDIMPKTNLTFTIQNDKIDLLNILKSTEKLSFNKWITDFCSQLYGLFGCDALQQLASVEVEFCKGSLTMLVKTIISNDSKQYGKSVEEMVHHFFNENFNYVNGESSTNCGIYSDKNVVICFLNIAECIRISNQKCNTSIKLNELHIGSASAYCEAYFTAIIYLELWAITQGELGMQKQKIIDDKHFQTIATQSCKSIGNLDAIYGFINPVTSQLQYLDLQNQWSDILLELGANSTSTDDSLYLSQLKKNGFYNLANTINKTDYEVLWRMGNWSADLVECAVKDSKNENFNVEIDWDNYFERQHYLALRGISRMDESAVINSITAARNVLIKMLKNTSTECTQITYKFISRLQLLQQIEDFSEIQFMNLRQVGSILEKWQHERQLDYGSFEYKEITLSQQKILFKSAGIRAHRKIKEFYAGENIIPQCQLQLIEECKRNGNKHLLKANIAELKRLDPDINSLTKVFLEEADFYYNLGDVHLANSILNHIINNKTAGLSIDRVDAYRMYGEFASEMNAEPFEKIKSSYFEAATRTLDYLEKNKEHISIKYPKVLNIKTFGSFYQDRKKKCYLSVAKYADRACVNIIEYMNTREFEIKKELMKKNNEQASELRKNNNLSGDDRITLNLLDRNAGIDNDEINSTETQKSRYLCMAIGNYLNYCAMDNKIKTSEIYRIISLWFSHQEDENLLLEIKDNIEKVPSYKFIPVLNQLIARLNSSKPEVISIISELLVRCATEHPHHTLPHIFAAANTRKDDSKNIEPDTREKIANQILKRVKQQKSCTKIISQMEIICDALIEYANQPIEKHTPLTLSSKLRKLKNMNAVHWFTVDLPIVPSQEYKIVSLVKWNDKVEPLSGINAPKKLTCLCSDGVSRPQLLKGKDDLRQDAIMQQVFTIINDMLRENAGTKQKKLRVRTYNIVPLSKRSGILQWCKNTIPLSQYLTGTRKDGGAHKKYRPNDMTASDCRENIMKFKGAPPSDRIKIYNMICEKIKPVFHYYFLDSFLSPANWFEKRIAYINSVAANSMVGYILGIGDRHIMNILLDHTTAELIHIDFGIAFEQGKVMPTPEKVPFRLSRDIVAPMGVCGVNGIFRKTCEQTMEVLRENKSTILTMLEVLLYDPLYAWILDPSKIKKSQKIDVEIKSEEKNATAERAIIRVKAKLNGVEEGAGVTSVNCQVNRLIEQAMNTKNLALLYPGWDQHI